MKNLLTFALISCISAFCFSCKSPDSQDPAPTTPTPDATVCAIKKITYSNHATLSSLVFGYDANKRLVKITRNALKAADTQFDSLEYSSKGKIQKIFTFVPNNKKALSIISVDYDDAGKMTLISRTNSDFKDKFVFDANNQALKIESGFKQTYTWENDIYTFEYDKKGNTSKIMLNVTGQIPGFGAINHSYYVYESLLIDEKANITNTSTDLATYFFLKGDPDRVNLKNNPLQERMAGKIDVSYEPTGSKATVTYLVHSHKYEYNDKGLPIKDTDDISESNSLNTKSLRTITSEMTYECK